MIKGNIGLNTCTRSFCWERISIGTSSFTHQQIMCSVNLKVCSGKISFTFISCYSSQFSSISVNRFIPFNRTITSSVISTRSCRSITITTKIIAPEIWTYSCRIIFNLIFCWARIQIWIICCSIIQRLLSNTSISILNCQWSYQWDCWIIQIFVCPIFSIIKCRITTIIFLEHQDFYSFSVPNVSTCC